MIITRNFVSDSSAQVTELKCKGTGSKNIVWVSDLHGDSTKTNIKFLDSVIKKYPNSLLVIGGDHLDVMQNVGDRRGNKEALKDRFKKNTYLNEIIDYNVELWGKYAHRILAFFVGNHELTQVKFYGIDITRQMVKEINLRHKTNIIVGDMAGWLKLRFFMNKNHFTKNIYYSHRPITGGTRSKGMLSVDLVKGKYPDADIYISEHIHDTWVKPERVEQFTRDGRVKYVNKWVLQMPTLKDEFKGVKRGYIHDKRYGASPIGVVVFQFDVSHKGVNFSPKYELIE